MKLNIFSYIINICWWIVSIFLFFSGLIFFFDSILSGLFFIIASFVAMPKFYKYIHTKYGLKLSMKLRGALIIVFFIIGICFIPVNSSNNTDTSFLNETNIDLNTTNQQENIQNNTIINQEEIKQNTTNNQEDNQETQTTQQKDTTNNQEDNQETQTTQDVKETIPDKTYTSTEKIKIANWNLQIFGNTKASNNDLMDSYASVIDDYDIIFIHEIRNKDQTAFPKLCDLLPAYDCRVSSRAGRSSSKEQYGVIYKKGIKIASWKDYNPDSQDRWERPPIEVTFN